MRKLAGLFAFLLLPLLTGPARAQADEAQAFLEHRHEAVVRVLNRSAGSKAAKARRDSQLDRMLGGLLDYEALSKKALGSHWEAKSPAARSEFVDLLRQLVQRSYKQNLERTLGYRVRYTGGEDAKDGVIVRTVARSRSNPRAPEVSIDYRMHRVDGQWRVYDVVTDGVSMIRNYRNQFNRIIDKEGWDGLIDRMRKKLNAKDDLVQ